MISPLDISQRSILIAKMKALEAQFVLPLYNEMSVELRRQTEIALGDVYLELMGKEVSKIDYSTEKLWKTKNSIIKENDLIRSEPVRTFAEGLF